jgi:hypothetical protein
MPDEVEDGRFKSEVMRMLAKLISKANDHDARFEQIDTRFSELSTQIHGVASDLKTLTGQFNDVGSLAIKDSGRIDDLVHRVGVLEGEVH